MPKKVSIVLVGMNGYGSVYLKELLSNNEHAYITGVVDIYPNRSVYYDCLVENDIPIYESLQDFYVHSKADLAIISTPIHLHKEQSCYAMLHGSNVLCEKPASGNPRDIQEMMDTRDRTGKFLAIGFNWSFTPAVQQLKRDILDGAFGKPKRLKSIVLWPRDEDYYNRSSWAGKKYSPNGDMIFDSVANNATSHHLHHLLYLLGPTLDTSCQLKDVTSELYRANKIETFDTCAVRLHTKDEVEILYFASHAVHKVYQPHYELEFERATISYKDGGPIVAHFDDGSTKKYDDPENNKLAKLQICIEATANQHHHILCGIEAASTHVYSIKAIHESVPDIPDFPDNLMMFDQHHKLHWIDDLDKILLNGYEEWKLPSDMNIEWSKRGKKIELI
ncbi:Gfo/Idh/MocA family protein [Lederbergia lenta]|uniref:Oxidoreductase n=1 Tax=Lederbergia lenta TaxID=1467 RepID=A0A2X4WW00_LEDLE|nr:Gfo/Idh/MocA family oxidoreductase [Lederbergia lenta]MEC2322821.1 Gfo/Idh/MocA family oxidoreductase [Lederbergia lenta]SQI61890.1 oxidoreductase [Lederbergia lenta]